MLRPLAREKPLLELRGIVKRFAGNIAVDKLDLSIYAGEIHSLVGENGAGKSTLMKIIAGIHNPDSGQLLLEGQSIRLGGYDDAQRAGIGLVYQELSLLPQISVAENIFMGAWPTRFGLLQRNQMHKRARRAMELIGADLDPSLLVACLSMAQRQMVEIAKVLIRTPRIVIFDEPTTALSAEEAEKLFFIMERLKEKGCAVLFISHRLKEVLRISDRVTVMKDGTKVLTEDIGFFDENKLVSLMVGRELTAIYPPKTARSDASELLSFKTLSPSGKEIVLSVREGEVLGIGGLAGQGQEELLERMFGLGLPGGEMYMNGQSLNFSAPIHAMKSGIALVPQDRNREGGFGLLDIPKNLSAATLSNRQSLGFIHSKEEREVVSRMIQKLDIRSLSPRQECRRLSGGNMQKVVLGKWLLLEPRVMILLSPTRGIDIGTKHQIYHLLRDLAEKKVAVIVLSGDMIELIGLCDRVLVMSAGAITADLSGSRLTEEAIMKASVSSLEFRQEKVRT